MSFKNKKVGIVGTGLVGSSTAFSLITQGVCDNILMIDINEEKAKGEVMDLQHCIEYLNKNTKIEVGSYDMCSDVDVVVITAGAPPKKGQTRDNILMIDINEEKAKGEVMDLQHCIEYLNKNTKIEVGSYDMCSDVDVVVITAGAPPKKGQTRLDTLELSAKIVESIINPIMKSGFKGHFVVASNPADIIAYYVYRLSGLDKSHVIGTGTSVDSARLKNFIGDLFNVDPRSVQAYSMGEHGDSQMVPWSHVYIGGKPFLKVVEDNKQRFGDIDLDKLVLDTAKAGWEVYNRKGTTYYGIATAIVAIIKAILNDENKIMPVSAFLDG